MDGEETEGRAKSSRRRTVVRVSSLLLWGVIVAYVIAQAVREPSVASIVTAAGFVVLFALVNAQIFLMRWAGKRSFRRLSAKLNGAGYISELGGLPNRNYLLAELRREMPRARSEETPFTLIVFSLENLDDVKSRRGEDFGDRVMHSAVELLRRSTRNSDFLAHLGGARFCVLLVECTYDEGFNYLKRVPGSVAASDGLHMYDVPLTARMAQYDMESLYATDVLSEAEESQPLRRKVALRPEQRAA